MSGIDSIGQRVQRAFAGAPRNERLHVSGRLRSCPVDAVASATPASGRILDFGCGHGAVALYLVFASPDRDITGVDVDDDKIELARDAAKAAEVPVAFEAVEPGYRPTGIWDAITVVDVLYLLGERAALEVVDRAAAALAPGGVLVIKEIDTHPKWKYWLAVTQEVLATKLLRITEGGDLHFIPPDVIAARLEGAGLDVELRSCHRGRLHPHHLIIGRKPAGV
jgi:2-polyprenyl-3-methyl-5-hydroxy-6-metoxy-1,4-benzoquinol methylase